MNISRIIEFESLYTEPVKALLTSVLEFLNLPDAPTNQQGNVHRPYDDSDLDRIAETYTLRSRLWVALTDDVVVGMAAIQEVNATVALLRRMFVAPGYHGSGVGAMLLDTALAFAQTQGYDTLTLDTHHGMKRAHAFYEKHGFHLTHEDTQERHYARSLASR